LQETAYARAIIRGNFIMKRREFITIVAGAASWPLIANAQQAKPLVGLLNISTPSSEQPRVDAFINRFSELGWNNGRTVTIESRWSEGRAELFAEIAAEFVSLKANVIVTAGAGPVSAVRRATQLIPIVFAIATDPVGTGLVATLARPGGNITGLSYMGTDLAAKRLELLSTVLPRCTHLAIMANGRAAGAMLEMAETKAKAATLGIEAISLEVETGEQIGPAIATLKSHADALYVCADPLTNAHRVVIIESALNALLPSVFGERENVDAGGLMSYGPNVRDMYRRAAEIVDKILRGTKPANIPVEQPTTFELVINLKTAKTLGLSVPGKLLAQADAVIE
jgi:putative ABC transport system substrate-binding protein